MRAIVRVPVVALVLVALALAALAAVLAGTFVAALTATLAIGFCTLTIDHRLPLPRLVTHMSHIGSNVLGEIRSLSGWAWTRPRPPVLPGPGVHHEADKRLARNPDLLGEVIDSGSPGGNKVRDWRRDGSTRDLNKLKDVEGKQRRLNV